MKFVAFASAVAVSFAALTGVAAAGGVVPGSDYYTEAQADRQANTVIRGELAAAPSATVTDSRSFGYPAATGAAVNLVPGSRYESRAAQTNSINSVARGEYNDGYAGGAAVSGRFIPGSDSF